MTISGRSSRSAR